MKKLGALILVLVVSLALAACSPSFTDAERFAARANVTLNQGLSDYPNVNQGDTYIFSTLEYFEANGARVIRADCVINKADGSFIRYVFLVSDKEDYLDNVILSIENLWENPGYIEETNLFFINLFDFDFFVNEDNLVSIANTRELQQKYHKTGDRSILGME